MHDNTDTFKRLRGDLPLDGQKKGVFQLFFSFFWTRNKDSSFGFFFACYLILFDFFLIKN